MQNLLPQTIFDSESIVPMAFYEWEVLHEKLILLGNRVFCCFLGFIFTDKITSLISNSYQFIKIFFTLKFLKIPFCLQKFFLTLNSYQPL